MSRFSVLVLPLRLQAAIVPLFVAVFGIATTASAALLDWNVPTGDYSGPVTNWVNHTDNSNAIPGVADEALVRNGGTLNITTGATALAIRIGAGPQGTDPVGSTYAGTGILNWSGGNITGGTNGPRIFIGERVGTDDYTGIVNHSDGKIALTLSGSNLNIGTGTVTSTPTSQYNLSGTGIIGITANANGNNGINIRNGTFNMTGGQVVSDNASQTQRAFSMASAAGTLGNETVAYANFSGGVVDVNNGFRMNSSGNFTKAFVNISGAANMRFLSDFQMAASGPNTLAQIDMSGGTLKVGDAAVAVERRLIVGDGGVGVFNLNGGNVIINHELVVANNIAAKGTFYHTNGTLTTRNLTLNRNDPGAVPPPNLTLENAAVIIDGANAVFNQQNTGALAGSTTIGQFGVGRFEVRNGQANLRFVELSRNPISRATLNVAGGKLTIADGLNRTNASAATVPQINLTGGELEFVPTNPSSTSFAWHADLELMGTDFDPKPLARMTTTVGVAAATGVDPRPADFSLNQGSIWDLDIINGTLGGADFVNVVNGSGALNGGRLEIHVIGPYVPQIGQSVRILRATSPVTLNAGALYRSDRHWRPIIAAGGTEVHLTYVPEPTSALLMMFGLSIAAYVRRPRSHA